MSINVLLITMDQLRFDALGYASNNFVETPVLDWLASMGTVFENAYTPSPSCIPARACMMTGQSPWSTGVLFTGNSAGPYLPGGVMGVNFKHTLAGELTAKGYHTAGIGKMHFFPQRSTMGFSYTLLDESGREEDKNFISDYKEWFLKCNPDHNSIIDHGINWNSWMARPFHMDECYHPTNWTVNQALAFLKKRDVSRPFFLNVSLARPHSPYDPTQYFFDMYMNKDIDPPFQSEWSEKYKHLQKDKSITAWCGEGRDIDIKRARAGYYGAVTQADYQLGKLFTTLGKEGLLDEMLIIFTSDHGDMLGDHNLYRKTYAYEGSSHIPFIVKLPKSMSEGKHSKCENPVTLCDIMPTILEVCDIKKPDTIEGISLVPAIKGEAFERKYVIGEHTQTYHFSEDNLFVTNGKYKYIWFMKTGEEMFFDLTENRREEVNEISNAKFAGNIEEMRSHLVEILKDRETEGFSYLKDDQLVPIPKDKFIISPHYMERLNTSTYNWHENTFAR